jgi:hypothetical protein
MTEACPALVLPVLIAHMNQRHAEEIGQERSPLAPGDGDERL